MKKEGQPCSLGTIEMKDRNEQQRFHSCICCEPVRVLAWRELLSVMGKYRTAGGSVLENSSSAVLRTLLAGSSAEGAAMCPAPPAGMWQKSEKTVTTEAVRKEWAIFSGFGKNHLFQYLKGAYRKDGDNLFSRDNSDRMRGNGFKLKQGRFRLDITKKFFTMRVVKHWNGLPREAVEAPSLETFKTRLDRALSNLI